VLKSLGYATCQFGKNHLGDRDEHLRTMHDFEEFFGNLYHLNAEEELSKKRMETADEEFLASAQDFIKRKHAEGGPWFCYLNTTRMHGFTHLKPEIIGKTGLGLYPDGMVETDGHVGEMLALLEEMGVTEDTISSRPGHRREDGQGPPRQQEKMGVRSVGQLVQLAQRRDLVSGREDQAC
jgi:arylsulfatase